MHGPQLLTAPQTTHPQVTDNLTSAGHTAHAFDKRVNVSMEDFVRFQAHMMGVARPHVDAAIASKWAFILLAPLQL